MDIHYFRFSNSSNYYVKKKSSCKVCSKSNWPIAYGWYKNRFV